MPKIRDITSPDAPKMAETDIDDVELDQTIPQITNTLTTPPTIPLADEPLSPMTWMGRPRHDGAPSGSRKLNTKGEPINPASMIPNPKYQKYFSDHTNPNQKTSRLWAWWRELPSGARDQIVCYVYRTYPPLLSTHSTPEDSGEYDYIDVLTGAEPIDRDESFNDRYGAGDYHVFLNVGVKPNKRTLAMGFIKGNRDFKSLPPSDKRITELGEDGFPKWIDRDDPQNRTYIEYLRSRGIIPELHQIKKEKDAMAEAAQVTQQASTIDKLTNKIVEMAENRNSKSPALESDTIKSVIDASLSGARASTEMLKDTVKTLQEQITSAKGGAGSDTTALLSAALEIADKISKANDPAPYLAIINKLNDTVMGMKMEMLDAKIEQLKTATAPSSTPNPVQSGVSSLRSTIEDFRAIKDLFGDLGGEAAEDAAIAKMPWWGSLVTNALPVVEKIGTAWLMAQMRPNTPVPASMPQPGPLPFQQPTSPIPSQQPSNVVQMQPAGLPAPTSSTTPPFPTTTLDPQAILARLIDLIQVPLTNYIIDNQGGDDFADWFIGGFGEEMYADVIKYTAPVLVMGLYSYPPIVARLSQTPRETVEKFIAEFCSFNGEEWDRKKRAEAEREAREPTPIT